MSDESARRELAELVEDQLSRNKPDDVVIATLTYGISQIGSVVDLLHARQGNWAAMLETLRSGSGTLRAGISMAKKAEHESLVRYAQRQVDFAALLVGEIERLQTGETTLA